MSNVATRIAIITVLGFLGGTQMALGIVPGVLVGVAVSLFVRT